MLIDRRLIVAAGAVALFGTSACSEVAGPADRGEVRIGFATAGGSGSDAVLNTGAAALSIEGTNGTLVLDAIHMIVAEFELKLENDDQCPAGAAHESCEKFDAGPSFVELTLGPGVTTVVAQAVPAGVYDELEFEIEDLEDDEEDAAQAARIRDLRTRIQSEFPDWPRKASVLVTGTFTPRGGSPASFRTYLEAEIEIELDFVPPLTVAEGSGQDVTVEVDPALWFRLGNGTVLDLSSLDFDRTGRVIELEFELERGFSGLRVRS